MQNYDDPQVLARLAALKSMTMPQLRQHWEKLFDAAAPNNSRPFLEQRLAHRIQELAFGGLSKPINATMSPNGTMRVFSGLLLRMRSEAELAAVLGHEFGHFEKRHSLKQFKTARSGSDLLAWSALLASMSPSYNTQRAYQDLQISVYGSFFRFGRDQEREADLLGLGYLNSSDLRPQAAAQVWQNLMGEIEASATARGIRKPDFKAIAFTASHPPEGERAAYLAELADPSAKERDDGVDRYRAAMAAWLPIFLRDQIKLNDFGGSDYLISRLAENGWTADLWFARAELYRTRGNQRDLVNAVQFYRSAIELNPGLFAGLAIVMAAACIQPTGMAQRDCRWPRAKCNCRKD